VHRNINVTSFYALRSARKLKTVAEALEEIQRDDIHADTVVILPPAAGDSCVDSDVEPLNDNNLQNDQFFETAGEVEVEYNEAAEEQTNESEDRDDLAGEQNIDSDGERRGTHSKKRHKRSKHQSS
jgi:hypothetical protein